MLVSWAGCYELSRSVPVGGGGTEDVVRIRFIELSCAAMDPAQDSTRKELTDEFHPQTCWRVSQRLEPSTKAPTFRALLMHEWVRWPVEEADTALLA
jgi:hypothetical protein